MKERPFGLLNARSGTGIAYQYYQHFGTTGVYPLGVGQVPLTPGLSALQMPTRVNGNRHSLNPWSIC